MTKSVSFGTITVTPKPLEILNVEELWYSKKELVQQKEEAVRLAREHNSSSEDESIDESSDSVRGLEHFHQDDMDGSANNRKQRQQFVKSLLELQLEMKEMHMDDPKGIQAFASAHSSRHCKEARRRGKLDAAVVGNKGQSRKLVSLRNISPKNHVGAICA